MRKYIHANTFSQIDFHVRICSEGNPKTLIRFRPEFRIHKLKTVMNTSSRYFDLTMHLGRGIKRLAMKRLFELPIAGAIATGFLLINTAGARDLPDLAPL